MKVTLVSIRPTEAAERAGRPALTPELMAATGARYSRSNEGLETILSRIDPHNLDKSVDSIFRNVDYGHQSIADMAPVAIFMDDLSMWLVYYIWTLCATAGGQESSTRYIRLTPEAITPAEELGIDHNLAAKWPEHNLRLFQAYDRALRLWQEIVDSDPTVARIPKPLLDDPSDKARKAVDRMLRNYAFDRARYFLPFACRTNAMLVMPARNWAQLVQHLLSHPLVEANQLGSMICQELELTTPRMLRHSTMNPSIQCGILDEFMALTHRSRTISSPYLQPLSENSEHPVGAYLDVMEPHDVPRPDYSMDLMRHDNRYAWTGPQLRRIAVRFGWQAVALAEVRDLNRHRTGNKYCPLLPLGFYCAQDQLPRERTDLQSELRDIACEGLRASFIARNLLNANNPAYLYYMTLGTQVHFEHVTTANKFIYEAELRTGTGAHFRYADHLRDSLALWYERFPQTRGLILEGSAEPE